MLTLTQKQAIKADIAANPDLSSQPQTGDGAYAIAQLYMLTAVPDYMVWNPTTATKDVMDAITWANLTPAVNADGTVPNTIDWANRSLACQGKQFNIQTMLAGRDLVDATKANLRAGLQDALTNVPSASGGAAVSAGWANVKVALTRKAARIEKLLASGLGTAASPSTMGYVGSISYQDILDSLAS